MTLNQIIERVAKMPAIGPDADVILAAREYLDGKQKQQDGKEPPRKVLSTETE